MYSSSTIHSKNHACSFTGQFLRSASFIARGFCVLHPLRTRVEAPCFLHASDRDYKVARSAVPISTVWDCLVEELCLEHLWAILLWTWGIKRAKYLSSHSSVVLRRFYSILPIPKEDLFSVSSPWRTWDSKNQVHETAVAQASESILTVCLRKREDGRRMSWKQAWGWT